MCILFTLALSFVALCAPRPNRCCFSSMSPSPLFAPLPLPPPPPSSALKTTNTARLRPLPHSHLLPLCRRACPPARPPAYLSPRPTSRLSPEPGPSSPKPRGTFLLRTLVSLTRRTSSAVARHTGHVSAPALRCQLLRQA